MKNELIKKIDDAILNSVSNGNCEFLDSFLEAENYDLQEISDIALKTSKKHAFIINGMINRSRDLELLDKISSRFIDAINSNLEKPVSFLRNLIAQNNLNFQYRNLDKLELEDIKSIIRDQNLLELLERFENDEE